MMNRRDFYMFLFLLLVAVLAICFIFTIPVYASEVEPESVSATSVAPDDSSLLSEDGAGESAPALSESAPAPDGERSFMDTPFDDYTVTEGLLLILVVMALFVGLFKLFRVRRVV